MALLIIALFRRSKPTGKALKGLLLWPKLVGLICIFAFDKPRRQIIPTFKRACRAIFDLAVELLISLWWLLTQAWKAITGLFSGSRAPKDSDLGVELEQAGDHRE